VIEMDTCDAGVIDGVHVGVGLEVVDAAAHGSSIGVRVLGRIHPRQIFEPVTAESNLSGTSFLFLWGCSP
jgi:hypothetical protein